MEKYKLTAAPQLFGVNPWTLRLWVYTGIAPSIKSESGGVFIPDQQLGDPCVPKSPETLRAAV
jgi:hypothetical protein